jgi:hypothetical protein
MMTKRMWAVAAAVLACLRLSGGHALGQAAQVFFQAVDDGDIRPLTPEEKQGLQDPFFQLVLKNNPGAVKLSDIEGLLQPDATQRRTFVLDEEIRDPALGQSRRMVLAFDGTNGGIKLDNNVMVSVFFDSDAIPEVSRLEAWGWDEANAVFHYYLLDRSGTPSPSWKFRATSADADRFTVAQRQGTCLRCHTSGMPNMKELLFPWNNWQSIASVNNYLTPDLGPDSERWPVTKNAHFSAGQFLGAEILEKKIEAAIQNAAKRKLTRFVTPGAGAAQAVQNAPTVLKPLFATTEINLRSARQQSGLHPLPQVNNTGPAQPVAIPATFFLDSTTLTRTDVGINEAKFTDVPTIAPAEYKSLVQGAGLQITSSRDDIGTRPGDTNFAWFMPEPGFAQVNWIGTLLDQKVVLPAFAAAVLGVDVETPIFSSARAGLLQFVPDSYTATPGEAHPDALTKAVIAKLTAANPAPGSPEADFLAILQTPNPIDTVRARVAAYHDRVVKALDPANPATRQAELQRLFNLLLARRRAFLNHELFGNLAEFPALLPHPQGR